MTARTRLFVAIIGGAAAYVAMSLLRSALLGNFGIGFNSDGYVGTMDALVVFLITLSSGFVSRLLFSGNPLIVGFLAGAVGEVARGCISLMIAIQKYPGLAEEEIPNEVIFRTFSAGIPSGLLGAAGAAMATVILAKYVRSSPRTLDS